MEKSIAKNLVGHVINDIFIGSGEDYFLFKGPKIDLCLYGYGDCCSETWFSDVYNADNLRGHEIISVDEIDSGETDKEPERSRQECDNVYGIRIRTEKGTCVLTYRNSSNGYYGGSALVVEKSEDVKFRKILGDTWRAD